MITKSITLAPSRGPKGADGVARTNDTGGTNREGGAAALTVSAAGGVPAGS